MKQPITEKHYILHSESDSGVSQWHFSGNQVFALLGVTTVVLGAFLFISADFISKFLYDQRLQEFKKNYRSVSQNLESIQSRLSELDQQMLEIEQKDQAVRTYAGMPDVDKDIRKLGIGGAALEKVAMPDNLAPAVNRGLSVLQIDIEKLSRQVNFELASYESIYNRVKSDIDRIRHIPSIRPVKGGYLNSIFGYRRDPIDGVRRFHQGQDITVSKGTPIYAPADGKVKRAYYIGGFGNHIRLEHSYGYATLFAHLSKISVRHGQKVRRGDLIGYTGNTGRSTAPHLHYEVHHYSTPKNPLDYFFTVASK
ncbi:MAG TPA: hypothetical protein EYO45_00870 [Candidatus Marinimicrobia bacterium]|nr:hypothetical protein [Candidatus Neomarinimicrobiota bacterium]